MAEFKLGRIRFVWKGEWTPSTVYYVDDVIRFGGKTYICAVGHTSDADFNTDLQYSPSKWSQMTDGQVWTGDWNTSTSYKIGDIVKYGGLLYIANLGHTSNASSESGAPGAETTTGLEADYAKWDLFAEGIEYKGDWATTTRYKTNDVVKYGGISYIATSGHTSQATTSAGLEADTAYWDEFQQGLDYKGAWVTATRYKVNDVVKEGASLYIAATAHTAAADFNTDYTGGEWTKFVEGFENEGDWASGTTYQIGDIVSYGGNQYVAKTVSTGAVPTTSASDWDLFSKNFNFQSDWDISTDYKIGDAVRMGGYTYRAKLDSASESITITATDNATGNFTTSDTSSLVANAQIIFSGTTFGNVFAGASYYIKSIVDGTNFTISTQPGGTAFSPTTASGSMTGITAVAPPNTSYWDKLNSGINWRGEWQDDVEYILGDTVRYGSNAFICVLAHRSEGDDGSTIGAEGGGADNSRPDQDITGTYWNTLTIGSETSVLTTQGDMVYYSGAGPTRLPIGQEGQVLVSNGTIPEWTTLGQVDQVYYVSTNGVDSPAPTRGTTLDKPWATIRYACEQVENGARNPQAAHLLELNRVFLQRETSSWIEAQVAGGSGIWSGFDYDEYKCERDVGFIIDRLIWDITHGGNLKTRAAALTFVGGLGADGEFSSGDEDVVYGAGLSNEASQSTAAYAYLETIIGNVLNNTAPDTIYQDASDSSAVAAQYINTDYTAETGVYTTIQSLLAIVTDTITAGDTSAIPERNVPNVLINVKAGQYKEVLPIIVPAETCILGDEIRSTRVEAAAASDRNLDVSDSFYTIGTFNHIESFIGNVVSGGSVTPTSGNTETQDQTWPTADDSETNPLVSKLVGVMKQRADYKLGTKHNVSSADPTGYNSSYLVGYGDARKLLEENKRFLQEEMVAFFTVNYPNLKYGKTDTKEDVGHIVDALIYDLTYGGNYQTVIAARAYWDGESSTSLIPDSIKTETLAMHLRLQNVVATILNNGLVTANQDTVPQYRDTAASAGAISAVQTNLETIYNSIAGDSTGADLPAVTITDITSNVITTSSAHGLSVGDIFIPLETVNELTKDLTYWVVSTPASTTLTVSTTFGGSALTITNAASQTVPAHVVQMPAATNGVSSTTALITAAETLDAQQETLVTAVTNYIAAQYPSLTYNVAKCERDTRIILEAVMFDFMFNSNFATTIAAQSYLRSSATEVFELSQKTATRAAYQYLADTISGDTATYLNSDATADSRVTTLMDTLDTIIFAATDEGAICQTELRVRDYARLKLEQNRAFIKAEVTAYIDDTYSDTATDTTATTDLITISDTSWLVRNAAIKFTGTTFGGIDADTTYYVQNVVSSTTFKIGVVRNATAAITLTTASGSMGVELVYNETLCLRDVDTYIDALKWDLQWTSNYKSRYVARYYVNAALGSHEEDMYYVRNGTGIRNQTLDGLNGDLTPENDYGTSRVTAGSYVSLDPGWGPADFRTWIIARSPYVQGVTTFGNAAVGQKIDGALHNGGNDSIVSNDFTQVISDGIGAWVTNKGRAELVSVFTYYSHIGYLAEAGGRIRGTNGNNSYGDFGSVAEGFDPDETPQTSIVDNKFQYEAVAGSVFTDGADEVLQLEFDNAGIEYTEAEWGIFGAGSGQVIEADEFRDDAVHSVRLPDNVDDSTGAPEADGNFGGFGYVTASNTAQGGTTSQITIAATDSRSSLAYVGMKIYVTGGTGVGQFGIIATYNSGTKIATVNKETTGASGWDHIVPGTTIVAPDASSTYTIEPRLTFTAPAFSSDAKTLSTSTTWDDVTYAPHYTSYINTAQSSTSGSGTGATFDIVKKGTKYLVTLNTGGTGYARLDTVTINGSTLDGTASNDLTITITSVNSANGAVQAFDFSGYGDGGNFIALPSASGNTINLSADGDSWSASTPLPVSTTWNAIAGGKLTAEESAGNFTVGRSYTITETGDTPWDAIGGVGQLGNTFTATGVGSFTSIAGKATPNAAHVVAIAGGTGVDDTAYSIDGGVTWSAGGNLPSTGSWSDVAYGDGKWMAVKSGTTQAAITLDGGVTWSAVAGALPATGTWTSVAYGGGRWVVISDTNADVAYSDDDGASWSAGTGLSSSSWNSVVWGNNRFVAVSSTTGTLAAVSIDYGATWTETTLPATKDWTHVEYGQGVFLAVTDTDNTGATSEDGIVWTSRTLSTSANGFVASAFGNPDQDGKFVSVEAGSGTVASLTKAGATARARAFVADEKIFQIRMIEPGSSYTSAPTLTITDPNNTYEAPTTVRTGKGVLANPSFVNRGTGFVSASADLDTGDGYADFFQDGSFVAVRRLTERPAVGSNVVFSHLPDRVFKLVQVLTFLGQYDGSYTAFFQVAPDITVFDSPPDGTTVTTRILYSQVRLTGHDFLDIGTGSFTETNYPNTPTQDPDQSKETQDSNGGRVFYTSTDQDGNFRVGDLFTIEQSTGVATLNADAFNISGLQELSLGEVTLGGGSASITEFSTDPFFTQNSDSVVPTQRAIKAYISSQIGGGGAALNVNSVTAGSIYIFNNVITTTTQSPITFNATVEFKKGVTGVPLAFQYFLI